MLTITEALAEIKLIDNKIEAKQQFVTANLYRAKHLPDPLGDTKAVVESEVQAIGDLRRRRVKIRKAIAEANLKTEVKIGESTLSIFEWLTWRREVAGNEKSFLRSVHANIKMAIDAVTKTPKFYKDESQENKIVEIVPSLDHSVFAKAEAEVQEMLDKLDGLLSLKNATVTIDV